MSAAVLLDSGRPLTAELYEMATPAEWQSLGRRVPGTLWQRIGSASGPVRGTRRYAVGTVVDHYEGRRLRAIEVETRDEVAVSRVRRPHEVEANAYPSCLVYAKPAEGSA
jgi:hypothetical protein